MANKKKIQGGSDRLYAVKEAYYSQEDDQDRGRPIAGIPPYGFKYFGEYTGSPSQASKKAFTGLQKHMKKYHKDSDWFPGYDPSTPPKITFMMVDVSDPDTPMWYVGRRIPAHQGNRVIKNKDGRIRNYKWDAKVEKVKEGSY